MGKFKSNKIIYYTLAQKKAIMTYRSKNKEHIQQQNKLLYEKYKLDPDFMVRRREMAKQYYMYKTSRKINLIQ